MQQHNSKTMKRKMATSKRKGELFYNRYFNHDEIEKLFCSMRENIYYFNTLFRTEEPIISASIQRDL